MNDVTIKKDGMVRLENGMKIPCDATTNLDATFDTKLVATIGEQVYYLQPDFDWNNKNKMLVTVDKIVKSIVYEISYATGCTVLLHCVNEQGKKFSATQELFYLSKEEAKDAVLKINQYYKKCFDFSWESVEELMSKGVNVNYRYWLKFPVKPQDILLEDNEYYIANRVIAEICADYASVLYQGPNDKTFYEGREVCFMKEYAGIKDEYEIVPMLVEKEVIIDAE